MQEQVQVQERVQEQIQVQLQVCIWTRLEVMSWDLANMIMDAESYDGVLSASLWSDFV